MGETTQFFIFISFIIWIGLASQSTGDDHVNPVVSVENGRLKGSVSRVKGTERLVHEYLGIPFAKPPLGSLRLIAPEPPEPWTGVRDATRHPAICIQNVDFIEKLLEEVKLTFQIPVVSEDCLYLNIYTPAEFNKESRLPVMVWIHGGGLMMGAASHYDGSALAAYENVVVVVIQYRLGILGFLSTGDDHCRGNWGLLDQIAALQWVQRNIKTFGGDPDSVTIFGESAGGCSVSALIFSPLSSGLFHKAISQSGTAMVLGILNENIDPVKKAVANMTACDDADSRLFVKCMREKTEEDLLEITKKFTTMIIPMTVDGVFLPKPLSEMLKSKSFHQVPYLLGITNNEVGWLLANTLFPPGWQEGIEKDVAVSLLNKIFPAGIKNANEYIFNEYVGNITDPTLIRDLLTEISGDMLMVKPTIIAANAHRDAGSPVYLYEFQHRPSLYGDIRPSFVKSDHADDIGFVFGACFWNGHIKLLGNLTEEENQLCRTIMAYWANFARNGNPNGDGLESWPLYNDGEQYMALNLKQSSGRGLKKEKMTFLIEKLPELMKEHKKNTEVHMDL
ncbi:fatty acyl-CoA hydrolase precursor, medium chain-like isoform X4 [Erpetoichthys calabaricus]|uniref:fatty acyl-CoA hydrolase precursor, medium chain-like isoform X4 n=1 Tax=Erpetoichthys calabaricus TaxID=27687 RepID=UPI002234D4C6|nr:fatty acyl-CoA hydrolase precursor, medium chain-like isoform X4 [Erpetoichthys calabaricus]